jgi:NADPH2:quinone reductase
MRVARLRALLLRKCKDRPNYSGLWSANNYERRLSAKNVKLLRPTLFNYIATREELQAATKELWNFIEKDGLNVKIHDVYPLSDIVRATKDIESRKTTGKLVLKP